MERTCGLPQESWRHLCQLADSDTLTHQKPEFGVASFNP